MIKKNNKLGNGNRLTLGSKEINLEMAPEMNQLINKYFLTEDFENIEHELAGSMGIDEYLPLRKIDSSSEINQLKSNIKKIIDGNVETDNPTSKSCKI